MDGLIAVIILTVIVSYLIWFVSLRRSYKGPRVWPLVGSLPALITNAHRMHDFIADNLRSCGGTYQTCIFPIPFLARKQGLVTVTCDPKNLEHILKTRFDNYPKGPSWQSVFHDLLGDGIFNSDGDMWWFQRKTAALEFTTRTLRQAMARWVDGAIKNRLVPILESAMSRAEPIDLQDVLLRLTFDNICGLTFGKDPRTLSPDFPENGFAVAFDGATEATLQRFIMPEFIWKIRKWLRLGLEDDMSRSISHVDNYLSEIINKRKLELLSQQQDGSRHDDLLSRFMKKKESYLAYLQMKSITASVMLRHRLTVALGHRVEQKMSLTLFMKFGLKMDVHKRDLTLTVEKVVNEMSKYESCGKGEIIGTNDGNYGEVLS